jgi:RimJ/RimL family protein N-acetyltransferase
MGIDWSEPAVLKGQYVTLVPTTLEHLPDLEKHLLGTLSWHNVFWPVLDRADLVQRIEEEGVRGRQEKTFNTFSIREMKTNEIVGLTSLRNFSYKHQTIEIGATCIGERWQKSYVNTEAKLLLMGYVFETLKPNRIVFNVDALNFNSQRAVLRLGAKFEGELRQSWLQKDGQRRDRRIYSVIDFEWPAVKTHLHWLLQSKERIANIL